MQKIKKISRKLRNIASRLRPFLYIWEPKKVFIKAPELRATWDCKNHEQVIIELTKKLPDLIRCSDFIIIFNRSWNGSYEVQQAADTRDSIIEKIYLQLNYAHASFCTSKKISNIKHLNCAYLFSITEDYERALNELDRCHNLDLEKQSSVLTTVLFKRLRRGPYFQKLVGIVSKHNLQTLPKAIKSQLTQAAIYNAQTTGYSRPPQKSPLLTPDCFQNFMKTHEEQGSTMNRLAPPFRDYILTLQEQESPRAVRNNHRSMPNILVVSDNWNFMPKTLEVIQQTGGNVRTLDFASIRESLATHGMNVTKQIHETEPLDRAQAVWDELSNISPFVNELISWADIVFVDWWSTPAVWFTRYLPSNKQLIVRCHSFEIFTDRIYWSNFSRIDLLIFIAPHIKKAAEAVIGRELLKLTRCEVIPNFRTVLPLQWNNRCNVSGPLTTGCSGGVVYG